MADKITPSQVIQQDTTPDGIPIHTTAAPIKSQQQQQQPPSTEKSIADLPVVKEGDQPKTEEQQTEKKVVDFNDFIEASGKPKVDVIPPTETTEKKIDDKVPVDDKKVVTIPKGQEVQKDDKTRDYTEIDEKDVPHFKRMSNEAFAAFKPVYLEHKKLKSDLTTKDTELTTTKEQLKKLKDEGPQLPDSYFEHPDSYLLDPAFRQNVQTLNMSQQILNHWQQQYDKVAEGATEFDMLDVDPKSGQLVITGKIPANRGSEAKLLSYITHAQGQVNKVSTDVQVAAKTHNVKYSDNVKGITDLRTKYFTAFYNTPENKAIYEPLVRQHLDSFPAAFRNSPVAVLAAEALVMSQVMAAMVKKATESTQQKVDELVKPKEINRTKQPTAGEITGDGRVESTNGDDKDVSIDDYNRVKNGY